MHKLVALRNKPARQFIIDGRAVHIHTGSTRLVDEELAEKMRAYIEANGLESDYRLIEVTAVVRAPSRPPKAPKKTRSKPRALPKAPK